MQSFFNTFSKKFKKNKIEENTFESDRLAETNYILELDNVKKYYGKVEVLKGISFKMEEGERIAIVGANGAGKSTLIEIISRVKDKTSGHIYYSFGKTKSEVSAKIGIQFQDSSYPDYYKVKDLVSFIIDVSGIKITEEELKEIYETFDLWKMRKDVAKGLSGGQQQRLNILLAIINNPKLLILDEVGTGLDVESRTKIKSYIKSYVQEHKATLILVSHNADEVTELTDRVIVVHNGLIYEDQPLKNILKKWKQFDLYMNYLYLEVFKKNLDLRANKTGRHNEETFDGENEDKFSKWKNKLTFKKNKKSNNNDEEKLESNDKNDNENKTNKESKG